MTDEWPEKGDLVVVRIKRIMQYGAVADLLEYPGKEGFIHISKISSSWVKNIRNFLSEGQMRVARVTRVIPSQKIIDISLRDVSKAEEKRKMDEYKKEKRAQKLWEQVEKKVGKKGDKIKEWLIDEFGDLYSAFEAVVLEGEEPFKDMPRKWFNAFAEIAKNNISIPEVEIKGVMTIKIPGGNGINKIKEILSKVKYSQIEYYGAPKYGIRVKAQDYKEAEKRLKKDLEVVEKGVKKAKGEFGFERIKD